MSAAALLLLALACLAPLLPASHADHGSGGGGGGCSGDCTAPTMGEDNSGTRFVAGGFGINGRFFDVGGFKQDVPPQGAELDRRSEITVRVYENGGPRNLAYVGLMLGVETRVINGIQVDEHPVRIEWTQAFDGSTSVEVGDKEGLVGDVTVSHDVVSDGAEELTEVRFGFVPLREFGADPVVVRVWDGDRNAWTNYFYGALEVGGPAGGGATPGDGPVVPPWLKLSAGMWAQGQVDDSVFASVIRYCLDKGIMRIPDLPELEPAGVMPFVDLGKGRQYYLDRYYNEPVYREWFDETFPDHTIEEAVGMAGGGGGGASIPAWVKKSAGMWADGSVPDSDFVAGIGYLVESGVIAV